MTKSGMERGKLGMKIAWKVEKREYTFNGANLDIYKRAAFSKSEAFSRNSKQI